MLAPDEFLEGHLSRTHMTLDTMIAYLIHRLFFAQSRFDSISTISLSRILTDCAHPCRLTRRAHPHETIQTRVH